MRKRREQPPAFSYLCCAVRPARHPLNHLHRHGELEIGYCHAGSGVLLVEGRMFHYGPGSVALIAAGDHHFHHSAPGTTSDWTFVFVDPPRLLGALTPALGAGDLRGARFPHLLEARLHPQLTGIARLLAESCRRDGARADSAFDQEVRGLVQALLAQAHRLPGREPRHARQAHARERLGPALDLIAERHAEALAVARLARAVGLRASAFRAAFSAAFGCGPKAYLIRFRLQRAAAALVADREARILSIALDCGFATLSSFNRHFRAQFSCTPRAWRRQRGAAAPE
jgi:AraC-like DNA-binding protein